MALGGAAFKALIVVQVALSTLLVVAATLFAVTLSNLKTQSLGFVAEGVLTLTVDADGTGIEGARLGEVHRQMLQKLQALPGVRARVIRHDSAAQLERGWETDLHPGRHVLVT